MAGDLRGRSNETQVLLGEPLSAGSCAGKRILLSTLSGHDKGEGRFYENVLRRLGCHVSRISAPARGGAPHKGDRAEAGFPLGTSVEELLHLLPEQPDLFLYVEPLGLIPEGIERAPFRTACVIGDCHRDLPSRLRLARFFDHVFLYQRNYVSRFTEHPRGHVHWMPYACDLEAVHPLDGARDLDVAFIGEHFGADSERARLMRDLASRYRVNEQRWYLQEEIPVVYSRAKIVVNLPLGDDLNFRFFEALSCGALLITRRVDNGQDNLFEEGKHFVAFASESELIEKIDYYLAHSDEREEIAGAGHREVLARHSLETRLTALVSVATSTAQQPGPVRRMRPSEVDRQFAWVYEYWRSADAGLATVARARRAGRPWVPLVVPALRSIVRTVRR